LKTICNETCKNCNGKQSKNNCTEKQTEKILGFEINPNYVAQIAQDEQLCQDTRIQVHQNNFFDCDWNAHNYPSLSSVNLPSFCNNTIRPSGKCIGAASGSAQDETLQPLKVA
jgi:hypothetical protein